MSIAGIKNANAQNKILYCSIRYNVAIVTVQLKGL